MNWNLTSVALTIVALGLVATFDIIPGAGFHAGVVMLLIGVGVLGLQAAKETGLSGKRSSAVTATSVTAAPSVRAAAPMLAMILLASGASIVGASAQDGVSRSDRSETRGDTSPKRTYTNEESSRLGAEAQRLAEARQRIWGQKMKRLSGSICTGC